jgi:ribonuclease J
LVPLGGGVMAARRRMLLNGVVVASVAIDEAGRLRGQPRISAPGLFEQDDPELQRAGAELVAAVAELPPSLCRDEAGLIEAVRAVLRRTLGKRLQKRPMVDVHLLRV